MTVAGLVKRFRQMTAYDLDPIVGLDAPDADVVELLDAAMVELGTLAYLTDPGVALTLTAGQATYPLEGSAFARRIVEPFSVTVDGRRLLDAASEGPGLWTAHELAEAYPNWPHDPPGRPTKAAFLGDRLVLHPAPATGGTAFVEAQVLPNALDPLAPNAVPGLPVRLHPGIVQRAVYDACAMHAQEGSQFKRLGDAAAEATAVASAIGSANRAARYGAPASWRER